MGYLCLCIASVCILWVQGQKVVKNSKDEYFYLTFQNVQFSRPIPDLATVRALGIEESSVVVVDDAYLANFQKLPALGSLQPTSETPAEVMRVVVSTILILAHPSYVLGMKKYEGQLNPSIELVDGELLMASRECIIDCPINTAWLDSMTLDFKPIDHMHFGLRNFATPDIKTFVFNKLQEDPRLLYMSEGAHKGVVVVYTSKPSLMQEPHMAYTTLTASVPQQQQAKLPSSAGGIVGNIYSGSGQCTESVKMPNVNHTASDGPKNWVAFQHGLGEKAGLYFIQNIHPMHILRVGTIHAPSHTATMSTVQYDVRDHAAPPLPWRAQYGEQIRGGTPAIRIPHLNDQQYDLYLAFFHTVAMHMRKRTYFMGAVTFRGGERGADLPQLKIHSMSALPIIPAASFYEGAWVQDGVIDYVLFPTGIVLVDGNNTLLVSFGSQDKDGYVMTVDLQGLLDSLTIVK